MLATSVMHRRTIKLSDKYRSSVELTSTFEDGLDRFEAGLSEMEREPFNDVWGVAGALVRSGVDWPAWTPYYEALRGRYLERLKARGIEEYRFRDWDSEDARRADMWKHYELACEAYATRYMPDDVRMPQFIEGKPARPSIIRRLAEKTGVPIDALHGYFLTSFDSQRFAYDENGNYEPEAWEAMVAAGVVRRGHEIDVLDKIDAMDKDRLKTALDWVGIKPERSIRGRKRQLRAYLKDDAEMCLETVNRAQNWDDMTCVMPPKGLTWAEFQSFRQQVKGMAVAIGDIMWGDEKLFRPGGSDLRAG